MDSLISHESKSTRHKRYAIVPHTKRTLVFFIMVLYMYMYMYMYCTCTCTCTVMYIVLYMTVLDQCTNIYFQFNFSNFLVLSVLK